MDMQRKTLGAMAEIAAQLAMHDDHIDVYMFWYRDLRRDEEQFDHMFMREADAMACATTWIKGVMHQRAGAYDLDIIAAGGTIQGLPPLDLPMDWRDVVDWFANDDQFNGGIARTEVLI
jgi:hypothetical protein